MKKLLTIATIVFITLSMCIFNVYAEGEECKIRITPNSSEVASGEEVVFTFQTAELKNITLENGIYVFKGTIEYDKTVFEDPTLDSIEEANGWNLGGYNLKTGILNLSRSTTVSNTAGDIFKLTLKTKSGVTSNEAKIYLKDCIVALSDDKISKISIGDVVTAVKVGASGSTPTQSPAPVPSSNPVPSQSPAPVPSSNPVPTQNPTPIQSPTPAPVPSSNPGAQVVKASSVSVTVIDTNNKGIPGVILSLCDKNGNLVTGTTVTTDANGKADFAKVKDLTPGTYYYKEVSVPAGYTLNTTVQAFTVGVDGKVTFDSNGGMIKTSGQATNSGATGAASTGGTTNGGISTGGTNSGTASGNTANGTIPKTGAETFIAPAIIVLIAVGTVGFIGYKRMKY